MKDPRSDPYYKYLKSEYLTAIKLLHPLQNEQAADKKALNYAETDEERRLIRHRLMSRRKGFHGLRALNNTIVRFYRYCEEKHIFAY